MANADTDSRPGEDDEERRERAKAFIDGYLEEHREIFDKRARVTKLFLRGI